MTTKYELPVIKMIETKLKENYPEFDIRPGTAYRDMLIKPSALLMQPIRDQNNIIKKNLSLANYTLMQDDEFNAMLKNVFVDRRPGAVAKGTVRLYFTSPIDISISDTTTFSTEDLIEFQSPNIVTFTAEEVGLNVEGSLFYVDIDVEAVEEGITGNVPANSIAFVVNGPGNVARIDNLNDFAGGTDQESRAEAYFRAKKSIGVRDLVTRRSIEAVILEKFNQVQSVQSVGFGDEGMERDVATICADYLTTIGEKNTGETTNGSNVFVDNTVDFIDNSVFPGAKLRILSGPDATVLGTDFTVLSATTNSLALNANLTTDATGVEYKLLNAFAREDFHIGGKVDISVSSTTVTEQTLVITSCPQTFVMEDTPQSFYEGNSSFTLPFMGFLRVIQIDLSTREQIGTDLVEGVDFTFRTLDLNTRFSPEETVQFELIETDALADRYYVGSALQIEYFSDPTIVEVNDFVQSDFDRVITTSYLVKSGRPTYIDISLEYSGDISEEEVIDVIDRYIQQFQFSSSISASDLIATLYFFNVISVNTETLSMTAETINANDTKDVTVSQTEIEASGDTMFIPRTIIVTRV